MGCKPSKEKDKGTKTKNTVASTSNNGNASQEVKKEKPRNIVLIGDSGVGKSSLLFRFVSDMFTEDEHELRDKTTVGTDYVPRKITVSGKEIEIRIWDTGGQERYATMTQSYYRQSDCVICVYDVSSQPSFETVAKWWKEMDRYAKKDIARILVGNKTDLTAVVDTTAGEAQAKELGASSFFETSAKSGTNVCEVFTSWIKVPT